MPATRFLGLIFVLVLICHEGRTESSNPDNEQDEVPTSRSNSFSIEIPLGSGKVQQTDGQATPTIQRRLSLDDFFLNRNQQEASQPAVEQQQQQQAPMAEFQVQQPDPNSVLLVRDTQFPSNTGGLLSRLLVARRMLRFRRIARRLSILPRMFGLGLRHSLQRSSLAGSPLSLFSNRVGEAYDPREYVFGNKAFSYQNNATSATVQRGTGNLDQYPQQTRGYSVETDPYYGPIRDSNYDGLDDPDNYDSQELNDLKKQQEILNSLTDEQQLRLQQQLQNYQEQLNQLRQQLINQNNNNNINSQNYQNQGQIPLPVQYQQNQHQQPQSLNDQQLEQLRQQFQLRLLREQQLQKQLQQLQLNQQTQNLQQHQNLASIEQENNYHDQNSQQQLAHSNVQDEDSNAVGDRTEGSQFASPIGIGGGAGGKNLIGVGVNVGIKPPGLNVQLTKPVASGFKPFQPIATKPVHFAPEPLVPIGILPKPILNLKGRLFFGAEMGKGAGVKVGR